MNPITISIASIIISFVDISFIILLSKYEAQEMKNMEENRNE